VTLMMQQLLGKLPLTLRALPTYQVSSDEQPQRPGSCTPELG
jgi:hypothetical protein